MPLPKIHFIWPEKNIDLETTDRYDFEDNFGSSNFLYAKLEPALITQDNILVDHTNFFSFQFRIPSVLIIQAPTALEFNIESYEVIKITVVAPSKN